MDGRFLTHCIKEHLTFDQAGYLYLLFRQQIGFTCDLRNYVGANGFDDLPIGKLIMKGLVIDKNRAGESHFEFYRLSAKAFEAFNHREWGQELYDTYPPVFSLSNGGMFIAKSGGDPQPLIDQYLENIGYSEEKHKFAMKQLKRYIIMVKAGQINGFKIIDWIGQQLWNIIGEIPETSVGVDFREDI